MNDYLLHLMRHGATQTPGLLMGRTDGDPTAAGIARCVTKAADIAFETVRCSDLNRAALPAIAIGATRNTPVLTDPRWRELDFGEWDGLAAAQVDAKALGRFWEDPDAYPPPEGERWSSLVGRVSAAIDDLPESDTLVVTHGGAIRAAMACLLDFEQRQIWALDLPYGTLLTLRIWPGEDRTAQIVGLSS